MECQEWKEDSHNLMEYFEQMYYGANGKLLVGENSQNFSISNIETFMTVTTPVVNLGEDLKLQDIWASFEKASAEGIDVYFQDQDTQSIHCVYMASLSRAKIIYDISKIDID